MELNRVEELVRGRHVAELCRSLGGAELGWGEVVVKDAVGGNVVVGPRGARVVRSAVAEEPVVSDVAQVDVGAAVTALVPVRQRREIPIGPHFEVVHARDCRLRVCDILWRGRAGARRNPVVAKRTNGITGALIGIGPRQDLAGGDTL